MAASIDPFLVLGVERHFSIDGNQVRLAQVRALRESHPDVCCGSVANAVEVSARVNQAAQTLFNDAARADALLGLVDPLGRDPPPESGFLLWTIELREQIDEKRAASSLDHEWVTAIKNELSAKRQGAVDQFSNAWSSDVMAARRARVSWRYIDRMIEALRECEDLP
ncbi:MAG: hypothetical protein O2800_06965 [Planctomycetota bacterium]|nr:hypothetical protein [Planctomycetota bacterium]